MSTMKMNLAGVNSWKTVSDLSTSLNKTVSGQANLNLIDDVLYSCEELDVNNATRLVIDDIEDLTDKFNDGNNNVHDPSEEKKLVGILKRRALDVKSDTTAVDDDYDEGLGDLDDIFDDFEEAYQSVLNNNDSVRACDSEFSVSSEGDIVLLSPCAFTSHFDSLTRWKASDHLVTDELSIDRKQLINDSSELCNISKTINDGSLRPSVLELDNVCHRKMDENDNSVITPTTKAKSVHFAIFPYVVEVPRVSDIEHEFDWWCDDDVDNNNDTNTNGKYPFELLHQPFIIFSFLFCNNLNLNLK